jgi:hypothetical protein
MEDSIMRANTLGLKATAFASVLISLAVGTLSAFTKSLFLSWHRDWSSSSSGYSGRRTTIHKSRRVWALRDTARCFLAAALSLFLVAGCSPTGEHWNVVHLSGVVRDSTAKTPLDSAWVALDDSIPGMKIVTDSDGVFDLATVEFGKGTLYAGKSGYKTKSKELRNVHNDVDSIFFNLTPSSRR